MTFAETVEFEGIVFMEKPDEFLFFEDNVHLFGLGELTQSWHCLCDELSSEEIEQIVANCPLE